MASRIVGVDAKTFEFEAHQARQFAFSRAREQLMLIAVVVGSLFLVGFGVQVLLAGGDPARWQQFSSPAAVGQAQMILFMLFAVISLTYVIGRLRLLKSEGKLILLKLEFIESQGLAGRQKVADVSAKAAAPQHPSSAHP